MARLLRSQPIAPKNGQDATRRIILANPKVNYTLTCAAGAYTYTGVAATLSLARKLTCAAGAYTHTGQAATLAYGHTLICAAGAYTYSGVAATLKVARRLSAAAGAYVYTGNTATLTYVSNTKINYTLTCAAGAYVYTGLAATLSVGGNLIGRKYPRGRSRPRKVIPEDIPQAIEAIAKEKEVLTEELAAAQADLVSVQLMAHNKGVNRKKQIDTLTEAISTLEHNINVKGEEEVLLMMACMALEM